jgi:hypothetical protein
MKMRMLGRPSFFDELAPLFAISGFANLPAASAAADFKKCLLVPIASPPAVIQPLNLLATFMQQND